MTRPLYQDEVRFMRYADSSRQGASVTFALPDVSYLDRFRGMEGKRFACVLIEIGDDEQPVDAKPEPAAPALPRGGRLAKQAGILCGQRAFQRQVEQSHPEQWRDAARRCDGDLAEAAAAVIREVCGIASRAELDHDAGAAERFTHCFWRPWRDAEAGITP